MSKVTLHFQRINKLRQKKINYMNTDDEELVKLHNDSLPVSVNLYQSKYTTARICKKVMENKDIKTDQKRCKVLKLLGHELDIKEIQY